MSGMAEQDDGDVIEQAPRQFNFPGLSGLFSGLSALPVLRGVLGLIGTGGRRVAIVAGASALLVVAGTLTALQLTAGPQTDPATARLAAEVATAPVGKSFPGLPGLSDSGSSAYSSMLLISPDTLHTVSGTPLAQGGKPEVFYVAAEYCPYCAIENWPLIVALSRFGQFSGLSTSRSPEFEDIAPIDSWTFYGSHFTSPYLSFVPVERYSNVLVNPTANPDAKDSYRVLQQLTPAQQAVFSRYDKGGSTPFLDFANRATQTGTGFIPPQLMAGKTWAQIAAALRQPKSELGAALLDEADVITAELCRLTGNRPATACPAFLRNVTLAPTNRG